MYLIVSIPEPCCLSQFDALNELNPLSNFRDNVGCLHKPYEFYVCRICHI